MIALALHAGIYVAGNALLALSPIDAAPLWPLAGWGVLLLAHALQEIVR